MTDFKRTTPKGTSIKYDDTASTKRMVPKGAQVSIVAVAAGGLSIPVAMHEYRQRRS